MSIERINATEYLLKGLPCGMRQNLDDEAYYEGEDETGGRPSERARDERRKWLTSQHWDTYIDRETGEHRSWYPGMDLPTPYRRITAENRDDLDRDFHHQRLLNAVRATPEGNWLIDAGLWKAEFLTTYAINGSMRVLFDDVEDTKRFVSEFQITA